MKRAPHEAVTIAVVEMSAVGEARRTADRLATEVGLSELDRGRLAIVVTEVAQNLVNHAQGGEIILASAAREPGAADGARVDVFALDRGKGMVDIAQCLRDGYSTGGSRGVGLGAIERQSDQFAIHSVEGKGTAVFARVASPAGPGRQSPLEVGAITLAQPGYEVSGDAFAVREREGESLVAVIDGLGHGPKAAEAARCALAVVGRLTTWDPAAALEGMHEALRKTRGAAAAVAVIGWGRGEVRFAGVGNIAGSVVSEGVSRGLASHNGTLGAEVYRFQEFEMPWPADGVLVLHSDGISARFGLDAYPGASLKHPGLLAGLIFRDHWRRRDDGTVVVARARRAAPC